MDPGSRNPWSGITSCEWRRHRILATGTAEASLPALHFFECAQTRTRCPEPLPAPPLDVASHVRAEPAMCSISAQPATRNSSATRVLGSWSRQSRPRPCAYVKRILSVRPRETRGPAAKLPAPAPANRAMVNRMRLRRRRHDAATTGDVFVLMAFLHLGRLPQRTKSFQRTIKGRSRSAVWTTLIDFRTVGQSRRALLIVGHAAGAFNKESPCNEEPRP